MTRWSRPGLFNVLQRMDGTMVAFLLWCILAVLCWPLALAALIAYPFVWF